MNYKMNVTIKNPQTNDTKQLSFTCYFINDPGNYGNGYYFSILPDQNEFGTQYIDLRYDKSFNRENPLKWLIQWAYNYWSGENGAWEIVTLEIKE